MGKEQVLTSKPPYNVLSVKCPMCGYVQAMGAQHKAGEKVLCSNCFHWFYIGS